MKELLIIAALWFSYRFFSEKADKEKSKKYLGFSSCALITMVWCMILFVMSIVFSMEYNTFNSDPQELTSMIIKILKVMLPILGGAITVQIIIMAGNKTKQYDEEREEK